jgi:hypothetical protein
LEKARPPHVAKIRQRSYSLEEATNTLDFQPEFPSMVNDAKGSHSSMRNQAPVAFRGKLCSPSPTLRLRDSSGETSLR